MRPLALLVACVALIAACASTPASYPPHFAELPQSRLEFVTANGTHRFNVWIAADAWSQMHGLMHVRSMPPDQGMLFVFQPPRPAIFWMKDTVLSLDLVFIDSAGKVLNIAPNVRPMSLAPINSQGPVIAVLEVLAGTARKIGLTPGNRVILPSLQTTWTDSPSPPAITLPPRSPN